MPDLISKCLVLMQVERAYHKTRSLSSPPPAKMPRDPHKSLRDPARDLIATTRSCVIIMIQFDI